MGEPNWENRTIWTGDNLPIMRGMNSHSVDLIYLDPPFNSKANYAAPIGSKAAGAEFKDTWTLNDVDIAWLDLIEAKHSQLSKAIHAAMTSSDKAYLIYMAVRLLEMKRLLKPNGSLYLHCDPTMSHYLKIVMDAIFGRGNHLNEISWVRTGPKNDYVQGAVNWPRVHDVLLHYRVGPAYRNFHQQFLPLSEESAKKQYRKVDPETGRRYQLDNLAAPGAGTRGHPQYEFLGVTRFWRYSEEKMHDLLREGRIVQTAPGRVPRYKRYLDESRGVTVSDTWTDIGAVQGRSKERTGYPTQKPLALMERVIRGSSSEGDVVLDPFCGCATTLVAADRLLRNWVGVDISPVAVKLVVDRIKMDQGLFQDIKSRGDVPRRTDIGKIPLYSSLANKKLLYGEQGGHCNGCQQHFQMQNLEVDHIIARVQGGTDHIENLQLLCGYCNRVKGDRGQEFLLSKLAA